MPSQKLSPHDRTVLAFLGEVPRPMTAYAILDALKSHGFRSPPTVYRALESLLQKGLVHRIESLNAYAICRHSEQRGHASPFAICTACGKVAEMEHGTLGRAIKKMADQFFAHLEKEVLELSGICHACAPTARKKGRNA